MQKIITKLYIYLYKATFLKFFSKNLVKKEEFEVFYRILIMFVEFFIRIILKIQLIWGYKS